MKTVSRGANKVHINLCALHLLPDCGVSYAMHLARMLSAKTLEEITTELTAVMSDDNLDNPSVCELSEFSGYLARHLP